MPYVDGVIYVVRYNGVSTRNAGECILRLREVGVPIIGAVLNRMSLRLASIYTDSFDASYEKYYEAAKEAATQTAQASEVAGKTEDKSDDTTKVS
jgi:Mrp family chromosome partitioning ATPase